MKHTARVAGALAALALTAGTVGCAGESTPTSTDSDKPFQFVAIVPESGALSDNVGLPIKASLETAIRMVNSEGGIDGRQVEATFIDSAGDAATAVANAQSYFSSHDKPDAVYAGVISAEALPLAPILTQLGVLNVTTGASPALNDPANFPYTFSAGLPSVDVNIAMADHLAAEGYKNIGFVAVDDESGHAAGKAFETAATAKGLTVNEGFLPASSLDGTATLEAVRSTNPDALVFNANGTPIGTILKARTSLQWDVPTFGDATVAAANLGVLSSEADWNNVFLQALPFAVKGNPAAETENVQNYSKEHLVTTGGTEKQSFVGQVTPLQCVLFVKMAYEGTDSSDPGDLAAVLQDTGSDPVPDSISNLWIGPDPIGFAADDHSVDLGEDDFVFTPAGPTTPEGFLVSK